MPMQLRPTRCKNRSLEYLGVLLLSCSLFLALLANSARANEKRVTVPLTLPFQQASSAAATSAISTSAYAVKPTVFIQSGPKLTQPITVPSSAAASSIPSLQPQSANPTLTAASSSTATTSATTTAIKPAAKPTLKPPVQPATKPAPKPAPKPVSKPAPKPVAKPVQAALPATSIVTVKPPPLNISTAPIKAQRYFPGHREAFVAEFENYIATKIAPFVPGAAVVIVSGGEIKSLQTFGVKKAGTRDKVTPDTVFRLASVSKTIASTAAAVMVKEGQLTWDSKITTELGNVKFKNSKYGNQLTLRHVLSQSSGLPTHTYSHFIDSNMAYAETVRRLQYVNFVCPPGKCYAYQNVVYSLAGEMIKKKAGMSYENYVEKKLFEPLGMQSASFGLDNYQASPNRATPHIASGKRWAPTNVTNNWYHVPPAAGANASIADMGQFLLAQLGRHQQVLPTATLNQTQARVTKNTPAQNHYGTRKGVGNTAYGLGWRVFDYGRHNNFVHHGGWVKGFRSEMVFNRDLQIGMVFLTNSESRRVREVIFKFMDMHESAYHAAQQAAKKQ